jgi:hypothetical protein
MLPSVRSASPLEVVWSPDVFGVEEQLLDLSYRITSVFYDPVAREIISYCGTWSLTDANSAYHAAFIESRGESSTTWSSGSWDQVASVEYVLIVTTNLAGTLEHWASDDLTDALYECGGSSMLNGLPDYDGEAHQEPYLLIAQCESEMDSDDYGLELTGASGEDLELEVDLARYFFYGDDAKSESVEDISNYTYDVDFTPHIMEISRLNGSTAGGTTIQLNVTGIHGVPAERLVVRLADIVCATTYDEIQEYRSLHLCEWDGVVCDNIGVVHWGKENTYLGKNVSTITCLSNPWDWDYTGHDGNARAAYEQPVELYVDNWGDSTCASDVLWSYADLWSSLTTWGGDLANKPMAGDSVVITLGEVIYLDESPPPLYLVLVYGGTLRFADWAGDIAFNASYVFVFGGKLIVGTESNPFPHRAIITITGDRNSYEIPVYGAKCIAVRNGILDLHGRPGVAWTRMSQSVEWGNNTIHLTEPVDWAEGDEIFIASSIFSQYETEPRTIAAVRNEGYTLDLTQSLYFDHWADGYVDPDTGIDMVPEMRVEVGRLTRNVIVQGDHIYSKKEQFGVQIVLSSDGDESLIGRFSNVEVRQTGQGLKLGKYPIHFHLIGNVSSSYVLNCSVHHANNRAIAVHGVSDLRVMWNVVFDVRGHAVFIEDGTEIRNTIAYNLVCIVRPIWSLLAVDQSPAAFWIVNPDNDVYGNVAAGASHYGFWYRNLEAPDGISGMLALDEGESICPNFTPLAKFYGNVAHSTGRHGLKVSDYFPAVGGASCPDKTFGEPAVFGDFVSYKNGRFGIWGEFLVDVHFSDLRILEHGIGGIEFLYINGKGTMFATSHVNNSLFVGRTSGAPASASTGTMCEGLQDVNGAIDHDGNGCVHAMHLPGLGVNMLINGVKFVNYEAALYPGAWAVGIVGGYTVECANITWRNVSRPITTKIGFSGRVDTAGILIDVDGTLAGVPGGAVAPYTGQFENNPDCTVMQDMLYDRVGTKEYVVCSKPIRRISLAPTYTSVYTNYERLYAFPHVFIFDVTDYDPNQDTGEEPVWDTLGHYRAKKGPHSCVPQAPSSEYMFLAQVGREYLLLFRDEFDIPVTANVKLSPFKMLPDESIVFRTCQKAPFMNGNLWADSKQVGDEQWGINAMDIGWESPGPQPPNYQSGSNDGQVCGLNELSTCGSDSYWRMSELAQPVKLQADGTPPITAKALAQGRTYRGGRLVPLGQSPETAWKVPALTTYPTDEDGVPLYREFCWRAFAFHISLLHTIRAHSHPYWQWRERRGERHALALRLQLGQL